LEAISYISAGDVDGVVLRVVCWGVRRSVVGCDGSKVTLRGEVWLLMGPDIGWGGFAGVTVLWGRAWWSFRWGIVSDSKTVMIVVGFVE